MTALVAHRHILTEPRSQQPPHCPDANMATLLGLPRELRDQIINLVVLSPLHTDQATTRKIVPDAEMHRAESAYVGYPLFSNRIHYLICDASKKHPSFALLLANRQLYQETLDVLARCKLHHQLHVAIIDWTWLWPTWRHIPLVKSTRFDLLEIKVSAYDCFGSSEEDIDSMKENISRVFSTLVDQVLLVGTKNAGFRTLCIDLVTKPGTAPNQSLSLMDVPGRNVEGMKHLTFDPLYACNQEVVKSFADSLEILVGNTLTGYGHSFERQHLYTKKFEKVHLVVDGSMKTTWGGEFLERYRFYDYDGYRN